MTLTIERKKTEVAHTTIDLPYYATVGPDKRGWSKFWAITGDTENMCISLYGLRPPAINFLNAEHLPEDAQQCSQGYFMQAYERAMLAITERFLSACPSAKAPEVTLQTA